MLESDKVAETKAQELYYLIKLEILKSDFHSIQTSRQRGRLTRSPGQRGRLWPGRVVVGLTGRITKTRDQNLGNFF